MSRSTLIEKLQDEYDMLTINIERLNRFITSVEENKVKSYNSLDKLYTQYNAMIEYRKSLNDRIKELYADENY